jgi:hypothetical protein
MGTAEDGRSAQTAPLTTLSASDRGKRVERRPRRKPRDKISALGNGVSTQLDRAIPNRHKALRVIEGFRQPGPENVESLADYKPGSKTYRVSLAFSGEAGSAMGRLMANLKVDNPNEVVKPAIALLLSAQGKEILLRDPQTGAVQMVEV